jgi:hypothetical protein
MWLLLTACRDPGVLPRQEPDEEWLSGRKPRTKEVVVNGHTVQVGAAGVCALGGCLRFGRAHACCARVQGQRRAGGAAGRALCTMWAKTRT